jgi:transcriptional regulator with XRE-family HTH domain
MGKKKTKDRPAVLKGLGLQIRAERRKKGISQESLAFEADLDRSYVGGVERGERNITVVNLKKIADALKVSLSELLKGL